MTERHAWCGAVEFALDLEDVVLRFFAFIDHFFGIFAQLSLRHKRASEREEALTQRSKPSNCRTFEAILTTLMCVVYVQQQ